MLLVLNPGHHLPEDPGACGNGLREADITVKLCSLIAAKAPQYGFETVTVHLNDLGDICSQANQYKDAIFFISLHVNSAENTGASGFESFTFPGSQKADGIRFYVHTEVSNFYRTQGFDDRGKKTANFAVLRGTNMPAMLMENLFVSNSLDAAKLKDNEFLDALAVAYCEGIARALGTGYRGKPEVVVPTWAQDAIMWAVSQGLISGQDSSKDFYRFITVLYRYDKLKG